MEKGRVTFSKATEFECPKCKEKFSVRGWRHLIKKGHRFCSRHCSRTFVGDRNLIKRNIVREYKIKKIQKLSIYNENCKKISEGRKRFLRNNPSSHNWSLYRKKQSVPESKFEEFSSKMKGVKFTKYFVPKESKRLFEIDFVIEDKKIGFEVNGNQHYKKNGALTKYCMKRKLYLESLGWKMIDIHYANCFNESKLKEIVESAIACS